MRGRVLCAVAAAVPIVVLACNALTGANDLALCEGAECSAIGLPNDDAASSSSGAASSSGGVGDAADDTGLPPTCIGSEKRCAGNVAAVCVNGTFQTTTCSQKCLDGDCVPFLSCRNTNGGACATPAADGSCCESPVVTGGTYNRLGNAAYPATISTFELDKFEVTVARFRAFVQDGSGTQAKAPAAGAGAHPKVMNSGWQTTWNKYLAIDTSGLKSNIAGGTWTDAAGTADAELKPITNVSWFEAFAFCAWDGGRLPTSTEWGYAAVGGSENRVYPWSVPANSTTIDTTYAAYYCAVSAPQYNCPASYTQCSGGTASGMSPCDATTCTTGGGTCQTITPPCTGCANPADVAKVGSYPKGAGKFGQLDLAGNAYEWTLEQTAAKNQITMFNPCNDCAALVSSDPTKGTIMGGDDEQIIYRGGAWNDTSSVGSPGALKGNSATFDVYNHRDTGIGFRCAHD